MIDNVDLFIKLIQELPQHGWIIADGRRLEKTGDFFTQQEVATNKVAYLNSGKKMKITVIYNRKPMQYN